MTPYMKAWRAANKDKVKAYNKACNIDADSNHYEQIKHLLDETVVLYGV